MNWPIIMGAIFAAVIIYLGYASSRNKQEARLYFDYGYERGRDGAKMTEEEQRQFDPLQLVAFDCGFNAGRAGQNRDEEFDYDWIKQTVKGGFQRGVF